MKFQPKSQRSKDSTKQFRMSEVRCHAYSRHQNAWFTVEDIAQLAFDKNSAAVLKEDLEDPNSEVRSLCVAFVGISEQYANGNNTRALRRDLNAEIIALKEMIDMHEEFWQYCTTMEEQNNQNKAVIHNSWMHLCDYKLRLRALKAIYSVVSKAAGAARAFKRFNKTVHTKPA